MVMHLDVDPCLDQLEDDLRAKILQFVGGGHREIAFLVARAIGLVRLGVLPRVPDAFHGIDLVHARKLVLVEAHAVEDVELTLGAKETRVRDAGRQQEGLRLLADIAWIARVGLAGDRIDHVAADAECRHPQDGVDDRGRGVRDQQHIALMDVLEPANARAIEADTLAEEVLAQLLDRDGEVLPGPDQVDELEIDDLQPLLVGQFDDGLDIRLGFFLGTHTLIDRHRQIPSNFTW